MHRKIKIIYRDGKSVVYIIILILYTYYKKRLRRFLCHGLFYLILSNLAASAARLRAPSGLAAAFGVHATFSLCRKIDKLWFHSLELPVKHASVPAARYLT